MSEHESSEHPPDQAETRERVDRVLRLFHGIGALNTIIDFERSFKITQNRFFPDRFLLGVGREGVADWEKHIVSICEQIDMPSELLNSFARTLADANHAYFGAERNDHTLLFKAYAEFRDYIETRMDNGDAEKSFLLFSGFKWDSFAPTRQAVTSYTWFPSLSVPEITERCEYIDGRHHERLGRLLRGILRHTTERISDREIQYLAVTEAGNSRQSFDINIYKSGLRIHEVSEVLFRGAEEYGIARDHFMSFYELVESERLGHLAGGMDREQKDFLTVYYGAQKIHGSQLASARVASSTNSAVSG